MVKFVFKIKQKVDKILLKTNLPVFHHSIVPYWRQAFKSQKYPIFSLCCRIFETINYMDLLKDIKHKRAKQRQKKPIKRDAFNQISGLVRQYGLEKSFLDALDKVGDYLATKNLKFARIRLKVPVESPLFSL